MQSVVSFISTWMRNRSNGSTSSKTTFMSGSPCGSNATTASGGRQTPMLCRPKTDPCLPMSHGTVINLSPAAAWTTSSGVLPASLGLLRSDLKSTVYRCGERTDPDFSPVGFADLFDGRVFILAAIRSQILHDRSCPGGGNIE